LAGCPAAQGLFLMGGAGARVARVGSFLARGGACAAFLDWKCAGSDKVGGGGESWGLGRAWGSARNVWSPVCRCRTKS
jgi:hypothetical protein